MRKLYRRSSKECSVKSMINSSDRGLVTVNRRRWSMNFCCHDCPSEHNTLESITKLRASLTLLDILSSTKARSNENLVAVAECMWKTFSKNSSEGGCMLLSMKVVLKQWLIHFCRQKRKVLEYLNCCIKRYCTVRLFYDYPGYDISLINWMNFWQNGEWQKNVVTIWLC